MRYVKKATWLRIKFCLILAMCIFCLSGCINPAVESVPTQTPTESFEVSKDTTLTWNMAIDTLSNGVQRQEKSQPAQSESFKKVVVLDSSQSMRGFLGNGFYSDFVKNILPAALFDSDSESNEFYTFGTRITKMENDDKFYNDAAFSLYTYSDVNTNLSDLFEKVAAGEIVQSQEESPVSTSSDDTVYLVITDFVSDSSSTMEKISTTLLNQFLLKDGYTLAILGWQSGFKGTMFDIPYRGVTTSVPVGPKEDGTLQTRPFYLVMLGNANAVKHVRNNIQAVLSKQTKAPQTKELFFSHDNIQMFQPNLVPVAVDSTCEYIKLVGADVEEFETIAGKDTEAAQMLKAMPHYQTNVSYVVQKDKIETWEQKLPNAVFQIDYPLIITDGLDEQGPPIVPVCNTIGDIRSAEFSWEAIRLFKGKSFQEKTKQTIPSDALVIADHSVTVSFPIDLNAYTKPNVENYQLILDTPTVYLVNFFAKPAVVEQDPSKNFSWIADWSMDLSKINESDSIYNVKLGFTQFDRTPYLKEILVDRLISQYVKKYNPVVRSYCVERPIGVGGFVNNFLVFDEQK